MFEHGVLLFADIPQMTENGMKTVVPATSIKLLSAMLCLPMALGCQLLEAETSVRRRFLSSSQASQSLAFLNTTLILPGCLW
jgi:hypothetical protein